VAEDTFPERFQNVTPDPTTSCGPYSPSKSTNEVEVDGSVKFGGSGNHDTIGMVAIDADGNVASGTSTNGASFKISG
jgi:isoaspartyl peptidase/L-asparaginase-like protein (Ntn-hydrolase superfamily)